MMILPTLKPVPLFLHGGAVLAGGLLAMVLLCVPVAQTQETLKGHIEQLAIPKQDMLEGQVLDAKTGSPIPDAQVTLPDQGFSMKTGKQGEYRIPRYMGKNPVIMSVEKPGYAPFSITITENAPPVFHIRLQKQLKMLVLDNSLRHLGDGSFSAASTSALNFRKPPDGPALRIPFSIAGMELSASPYLQIGSIIGLDTRMVHFLTGNNLIDTHASPLLIKLNGAVIAQVQVNGDNQMIQLPAEGLNRQGLNTLEIEAGYQYPEPHRIDYDDMELMHLVFYP